ncbi:glycosyltransferase [Akkermansiaceae bacterium]|nr:glycosyltransferase [Akkermansiaceae bacterium]
MISNVVITCNRIEILKKTFSNTISNVKKYGGEIIIVDNGSIDGTKDFLFSKSKEFNFIKYISNSINKGIGPARNQGLRNVKYDVVLCMDDDMLVDGENYLKCQHIFEKHKNAGVVAPLSIDFYSKRHLNNDLDRPHSYEVANHHGSFGIFLRDAVKKANYLDEDCIYGAEERSLCMKVHLSGYDIIFDPDIFGSHIDTVNRKKPDLFRVKMRVYNNVRLNFKYLPLFHASKYSSRILLSYLNYTIWSFGVFKKIQILTYFFKGVFAGISNKEDTPKSTVRYYTNPELTPYFGNNAFVKK